MILERTFQCGKRHIMTKLAEGSNLLDSRKIRIARVFAEKNCKLKRGMMFIPIRFRFLHNGICRLISPKIGFFRK